MDGAEYAASSNTESTLAARCVTTIALPPGTDPMKVELHQVVIAARVRAAVCPKPESRGENPVTFVFRLLQSRGRSLPRSPATNSPRVWISRRGGTTCRSSRQSELRSDGPFVASCFLCALPTPFCANHSIIKDPLIYLCGDATRQSINGMLRQMSKRPARNA